MNKRQFYSHPEILLKDHLKIVGENAKSFIEKTSINQKEFLSDIACIIGKCHDFGKYTSFFQDYLLKGKNKGSLSHHSMLSALFAAYIVDRFLKKKSDTDSEIRKFLPLITYIVVHRHHGDLKSPEEIIPSRIELKDYPSLTKMNNSLRTAIVNLNKQINNIKENSQIIQTELHEIGVLSEGDSLSNFIENFLDILRMLADLRYALLEGDDLSEDIKINLYFITLLLYSALIDADKKTAGRDEIIRASRKNIPSNLVDEYISKKFVDDNREINEMRREIYNRVMERINNLSLENKLFTLTAPTGLGKTLTALSFALKLREKIKKEKNLIPRIIYSLPFINIIEQNYNVFSEVLNLLPDFNENTSAYLIKHHHLADLEYKEGDEFRPIEETILLIESWESEIVVTTFVQFLHSVIAFKNSFLKKFHNIVGSIIILDEVQTIPIEYWDLVDKVLTGLTEFLDCRIILMTATKPLLLSEKAIELLEDNEVYFKKLNRIILKPDLGKNSNQEFTNEEFIDCFGRKIEEEASLIVLNTIRKSIEIYMTIKEKMNYIGFVEFEKKIDAPEKLNSEDDDFLENLIEKFEDKKIVVYLSTNITPIQRAIRIKFLKKFMEKGGKPILVSTQVVEAGVDLDFDLVFRDIGPLDSIIQVAGRCNRNYRHLNPKEVYILKFKEGYPEKVYGLVHLWIVSKLLTHELEEKNFFDLINKYFSEVKKRISSDESNNIFNAILKLNFYHSLLEKDIRSFNLIKESGKFFDIFIELDKTSVEIKDRFINEVLNETDINKKRNCYYTIKKILKEYTISVRQERLRKNFPIVIDGFTFVPYNQLNDYYDLETGYKYSQSPMFF